MNMTINQNNLYLLLPSKVAWMADMLSEDKNVSIVEADIFIRYIQKPRERIYQDVASWTCSFISGNDKIKEGKTVSL